MISQQFQNRNQHKGRRFQVAPKTPPCWSA